LSNAVKKFEILLLHESKNIYILFNLGEEHEKELIKLIDDHKLYSESLKYYKTTDKLFSVNRVIFMFIKILFDSKLKKHRKSQNSLPNTCRKRNIMKKQA